MMSENDPTAVSDQSLSQPNSPDLQLDPLNDLPTGETGSISHCIKKPQSPRSPLGFAIGLILSGVVGLGLGCLILYLVLPKHQFQKLASNVFGSTQETQRQPAPSAPAEPHRPQVAQSKPVSSPKSHPPQRSPEEKPKVPPPQWPNPPTRPAETIPSESKHADETAIEPSPQTPPHIPELKDIIANQPQNIQLRWTKQRLVLDLSHSVTRVSFPQVTDRDAMDIKIEAVDGLGTPYVLSPADGVLRVGRPVKIKLPDYPEISIQLSAVMRKGGIVEAAPKLAISPSREIALTQRWVKRSAITLNKNLLAAAQQLQAAKTTAQNTKIWLKSSGTKPLQLRAERKKQLGILEKQTIPTLTKNSQAAQARMKSFHRLAQFIQQIDGVAVIHCVMRK